MVVTAVVVDLHLVDGVVAMGGEVSTPPGCSALPLPCRLQGGVHSYRGTTTLPLKFGYPSVLRHRVSKYRIYFPKLTL